jgi:hypothetical protein
MIRSGTTLAEQIISSHPAVGAAGEVRYLPDHWRETIDPTTGPNLAKMREVAEGYLRRLRHGAPNKAHVTDKMPSNITFLGLAHILFPNARIIHCRRNVLDNCLSAFVTPLGGPLEFMHSAENIAFSYRQYGRLMDHWHRVLPADRLTTLDYEELVSSREPTVRRIIEFLGLQWDNACLAHETREGSIKTPSQWQARQPIFTTSVERWRHYEPWIAELERCLSGT